jgi:hypothetical protein
MTAHIRGYDDLLAARTAGMRPDQAVLLTDSEVIEYQWREVTHDGVLWGVIDNEPPPCHVLRIVNHKPHNLIALRGLPVLAMLTRKTSAEWVPMIEQAKPEDCVIRMGAEAYSTSRIVSRAFLESLVEQTACA